MKQVILSVINDLSTDQRVHRIASYLAASNYRVTVVGRLLPDSQPLGERNYTVKRMKLYFHKGKLFYIEFTIRLFFFLLKQKADIFTANDLDTLLPNYLVSNLKKKELVYDAHEFFTEVPELIHRPLTQNLWQMLEKILVPKVKNFMTVNEGIADLYEKRLKKRPLSVYNVPFLKPPMHRNVSERKKILIYQGALNLGRGIELMIRSLEHLPDWQLYLVGTGDLINELKKTASETSYSDRIVFLGKIPFESLHEYTLKAFVGLSLEEDLGLNYRFATPNKIFDYFQAEIPVIASDLPLMKSIVIETRTGEILSERTPEALARLVIRIWGNYEHYLPNLKEAKKKYCWENEQNRLRTFYPANVKYD